MVGSTLEVYIRHDAVKTVTPNYPEEAIASGAQGLVIAAVRFDEKGDLIKIKVLQSPHSSITDAVIQAVKEWKIGKNHKIDYGRPGHLQGELRFHFILENGTGCVEGPSDDELKTKVSCIWIVSMLRYTPISISRFGNRVRCSSFTIQQLVAAERGIASFSNSVVHRSQLFTARHLNSDVRCAGAAG